MASTLPVRAARTVAFSAGRPLATPALSAPLLRRCQSTSTPDSDPPNVKQTTARDVVGQPEGTTQPQAPRWSYTPPRAKAPFSMHMKNNKVVWHVNESQRVLDEFYVRMLGHEGDKLLSEELKWLAVTHKSFDQGRRGFNDRLAFLGKRIVQLQAALTLVQARSTPPAGEVKEEGVAEDEFGRTPFTHPALEGVNNLRAKAHSAKLDRFKLAELGNRLELTRVLRWTPRKPSDLNHSGVHVVLGHTIYAIIGAIALEKGGLVANEVARERVLAPLGLKIA